MTFELAETTSWFLADGEIHLLCFFFHLLEVLFVQLAVVLDVAVFVAESAMLDVLGWPWLVGLHRKKKNSVRTPRHVPRRPVPPVGPQRHG